MIDNNIREDGKGCGATSVEMCKLASEGIDGTNLIQRKEVNGGAIHSPVPVMQWNKGFSLITEEPIDSATRRLFCKGESSK